MKILLIDNYDSFTYNLVHMIRELSDAPLVVKRNDEFDLDFVKEFTHIILSPGPGLPNESGLLMDVIQKYCSTKKIFGVCLGLQAIGEVFGGSLKNLDQVFHGIQSTMINLENDEVVFKGVPKDFVAGRYHSWVVDRTSLPEVLEVIATDEYNEIMAVKHKEFDVYGVQFHPESIMTEDGKTMIDNFLNS